MMEQRSRGGPGAVVKWAPPRDTNSVRIGWWVRSRYEITCPFIGVSLRLLMPCPECLRSNYSLATAYRRKRTPGHCPGSSGIPPIFGWHRGYRNLAGNGRSCIISIVYRQSVGACHRCPFSLCRLAPSHQGSLPPLPHCREDEWK